MNYMPPQQPQQPWYPAPEPPTHSKATTSMALGIAGLLACPILMSIPAIVLGYQARSEINASNGAFSGLGMAKVGIITGWAGLAIWALLILAFAALAYYFPYTEDRDSLEYSLNFTSSFLRVSS
jgi:hypothetical protein